MRFKCHPRFACAASTEKIRDDTFRFYGASFAQTNLGGYLTHVYYVKFAKDEAPSFEQKRTELFYSML